MIKMRKAQFDIEDLFAFLLLIAMIVIFFFLFSLSAQHVKNVISEKYESKVKTDMLLATYLVMPVNEKLVVPEKIGSWYLSYSGEDVKKLLEKYPSLIKGKTFGEFIAELLIINEERAKKEELFRVVANDVINKKFSEAHWHMVVDDGSQAFFANNFGLTPNPDKLVIRKIPLPGYKSAEVKFIYEAQNE